VALATGVASGLLNGLAGVGGPPAVLFWFSGAHAAHVGRASVIAYFLFTDVIALGMAGAGGLVDPRLAGLLSIGYLRWVGAPVPDRRHWRPLAVRAQRVRRRRRRRPADATACAAHGSSSSSVVWR
jgi:hypothetical protein